MVGLGRRPVWCGVRGDGRAAGAPVGAATLTALVVSGQLICSVMLDQFGWIGFELHPTGMGRIAGSVLLLSGTLLIWRFLSTSWAR